MLWTQEALDAELLLREFPEAARKHSARYLRERNPRLYQAITLALKYGIPVCEIAKQVEVGENTVRAVQFAEHSSVEDGKEVLKSSMRRFLHGAIGIMNERIDEIPVEKLMMAVGIINQNLLLLEGQATAIVQHQRAEASLEDIAKQIEAAQRKAHGRVVDAEEMGSEAGNESANGASGPPAAAPPPGPTALTEGGLDIGQMPRPSGLEAAVKRT